MTDTPEDPKPGDPEENPNRVFVTNEDFARTWVAPTLRRKVEIIHDATEVRCRGEALHPVWWQGRQWAVTEYGIECRDGSYYIEANRLDEFHPGWSWLMQLGEKPWVDIEDFATAYLVALTLHGVTIDPETLKEAIRRTPTPEPREASR